MKVNKLRFLVIFIIIITCLPVMTYGLIHGIKTTIELETNQIIILQNNIVLEKETNDYVYTTSSLNCRKYPNVNSEILYTLNPSQEIYRFGICSNGWSKVLVDNIECYVDSSYILKEKPKQQNKTNSKYTPDYLRTMGVIFDGDWRYTWYSERVLPGGGLNIPGRYSDGNFVRDGNGYICVASSDLSKGTVVETPWGTAKVYDCGCASGTIDIYVSW